MKEKKSGAIDLSYKLHIYSTNGFFHLCRGSKTMHSASFENHRSNLFFSHVRSIQPPQKNCFEEEKNGQSEKVVCAYEDAINPETKPNPVKGEYRGQKNSYPSL